MPKYDKMMISSFLDTVAICGVWINILLRNFWVHLSINFCMYIFFYKIFFSFTTSWWNFKITSGHFLFLMFKFFEKLENMLLWFSEKIHLMGYILNQSVLFHLSTSLVLCTRYWIVFNSFSDFLKFSQIVKPRPAKTMSTFQDFFFEALRNVSEKNLWSVLTLLVSLGLTIWENFKTVKFYI